MRVWFAYADGDIWLRTDETTDWYRNLLREPRCRIAAGGTELDAIAEPVHDETALRTLVERLRAKYGAEWVADWYVERGRAAVRLRIAGATASSSRRTG